MNARGRPRIPTPDVQKDGVVDKDNKQNMSINGSVPPGTYTSDLPAVVQVWYYIQYIGFYEIYKFILVEKINKYEMSKKRRDVHSLS